MTKKQILKILNDLSERLYHDATSELNKSGDAKSALTQQYHCGVSRGITMSIDEIDTIISNIEDDE
jgi:hypothetical protein